MTTMTVPQTIDYIQPDTTFNVGRCEHCRRFFAWQRGIANVDEVTFKCPVDRHPLGKTTRQTHKGFYVLDPVYVVTQTREQIERFIVTRLDYQVAVGSQNDEYRTSLWRDRIANITAEIDKLQSRIERAAAQAVGAFLVAAGKRPVYQPQVGDRVIVTGLAYLPHIGVEVDLPADGDRPLAETFDVTDISADNYGVAIHLTHTSGVTCLYVTPEDIEFGKTRVALVAKTEATETTATTAEVEQAIAALDVSKRCLLKGEIHGADEAARLAQRRVTMLALAHVRQITVTS